MPSGQPETHEEFELAAQAIWDGLPQQFLAALGNVTVRVARFRRYGDAQCPEHPRSI